VDFVALSFVRTADDVRSLRQVMEQRWGKGAIRPIIAKIEKPQAIMHIEDIIEAADGVMVARGDLGVEMPPEEVPVLQKRIIRLCNDAGKPVIVATQMLESMIGNPTPTRAEANDVANAVIDGADAVMLSGETSVGKFPVEAVAMMNRVALTAEASGLSPRFVESMHPLCRGQIQEALGRAACVLAEEMKAAAVVAVTRTGATARVVARYRPSPPIVAVTASEQTVRALSLVWGIRGFVLQNTDREVNTALLNIERQLVEGGFVQKGEAVVLLAGQSFFDGRATNILRVEKVVGE
jgi:pyruvate kinase